MKRELLYQMDGLKLMMFARDPDRTASVIDTNEYLVVARDNIVMMDPGGTEIFPSVVAAVSHEIDVATISTFVCSHQDPDVMSSLPLWMGLCPRARIHLPWLWSGFVAHFGHEYVDRFVCVPDDGHHIPLGDRISDAVLVPAHYCHSSGNFSMYLPDAKALLSGDIGAALLPDDFTDLFVTDFDKHISLMEKFHQRWMPSNRAKNRWIARVRGMAVDLLCPQHGAVFRGPDVARFLDWFEALEVGSGV